MKTFIITGAGSGLGKELAILLTKKSYHVVLNGRNIEKLLEVKKEIEGNGGKADISRFDIRKTHEARNAIDDVCKRFDVFGLVNNAGVGYFGPLLNSTEKQIIEMLETNALGTIYLTQAILPYLLKTEEGHIINIISTAGLRGKVNESVYAASKFAVRGFTESLQKEYANTNIKITAVYMGGMKTPFWENSNHIEDTSRLRSPQEIADIIITDMNKDEIIIENKKS